MEEGQKKLKVFDLNDNFSVNQLIKNQGYGESFGMDTDLQGYEHKKVTSYEVWNDLMLLILLIRLTLNSLMQSRITVFIALTVLIY